MLLCPETAIFAANKAIRTLEESGQVGYTNPGKVLVSAMGAYSWYSTTSAHRYTFTSTDKLRLNEGEKIIVTINGEKYTCACTSSGNPAVFFGNPYLNGSGDDSGEDIGIVHIWVTGQYDILIRGEQIAQDSMVTISEPDEIVPSNPKYLPNTVATKADIFGAMEASY